MAEPYSASGAACATGGVLGLKPQMAEEARVAAVDTGWPLSEHEAARSQHCLATAGTARGSACPLPQTTDGRPPVAALRRVQLEPIPPACSLKMPAGGVLRRVTDQLPARRLQFQF
jgi:hypothetical protein